MAATAWQLPKAAVFVDAENHADLDVSALTQRLAGFDVLERHAYADQRNWQLGHLLRRLKCRGFKVHHTWSGPRPGMRKNTADGHMARGITRVLSKCPEVEVVVIVSGDAFFADVARRLQEHGRRVVVAAAPLRTSKELRRTADEYMMLGRLERSIRRLHRLELTSRYVTFGFAVRELDIAPSFLADLIRRGLVIQRGVPRSGRGPRAEIHLNHQAYAVQTVLELAA